MKKFLILILLSFIANAHEVEVKVLKTTARTKPHERKVIEKKLSEKINRPKASGTSQK